MIEITKGKFRRLNEPIKGKPNYLRIVSERFEVEEPDGPGIIGPAVREFIHTRNAVAVLPICPSEQKILIARQFRMPVMHDTGDYQRAWIYEAIAGVISDGEDPIDCGVRETLEESSVVVLPERMKLVADYYVSPGVSSERHYVFTCEVDAAEPSEPSGGLEEEHEALKPAWLTFDEIRALRSGGRIEDGKTIMALMSAGL